MKLLALMGRGDAAVLMTAVKMGERGRNRVKGIHPVQRSANRYAPSAGKNIEKTPRLN
jgi:hypothetical protein